MFASAREFHLHGRPHHGAYAYKAHCRKTFYPRNYIPANTQEKKQTNSHTFSWGTCEGFHICLSALPARLCMCRLSNFLQSHHNSPGTASALLAKSSPFLHLQLKVPSPVPPPQIVASPEQYGLYYSNDIYYTSPGFISYLFLILLFSSN